MANLLHLLAILSLTYHVCVSGTATTRQEIKPTADAAAVDNTTVGVQQVLRDAADKTLRFLTVGDWGGTDHSPYTSHNQLAVRDLMAKTSTSYKAEFILALGDNFYYNGVKSVHDPRFKETFEDVYTGTSLHIPWYVVAGNHDYHGSVKAQIEYSKVSSRWKFPYYYYDISKTIPGTNDKVDIIMLDTMALCGRVPDDFHDYQPEEPDDADLAENQWAWLESLLASSKSKYLFTAGHYPVYSIGSHGPTHCLTHRLQPLLEKYKVSGHLCGHDHDLQHLKTTSHGHTIHYFVSGSGRFVNHSTKHKHSVPSGSSIFHWADTHHRGGILLAEAASDKMTFTFIREDGHKLHEVHVSPRNV